jgi:hypothetical protein
MICLVFVQIYFYEVNCRATIKLWSLTCTLVHAQQRKASTGLQSNEDAISAKARLIKTMKIQKAVPQNRTAFKYVYIKA